MKLLTIFSFLFLLQCFINCYATPLDETLKTLSPDEASCYYWNALHNTSTLKVPADQVWSYLDDHYSKAKKGEQATRGVEVALFLARQNQSAGSAAQLQKWYELALNSKNLGDQLAKEITTTLVVLTGVESSKVERLFVADDARVREAALRAASIYGSAKYRDELFAKLQEKEHYHQKRIREAFGALQLNYEKGRQLLEKEKNEYLFDHSAYKELKDYMYYHSEGAAQGLSAREFASWMGSHLVHKLDSTSTDIYGGGGAFLESSLTNFYWLERLSGLLKSAANAEERNQLEDAYREGLMKSQPDNMEYAVRLYYLLGFDLSDEEEKFLLNDTKLLKEKMLPSGRIHLLGSYDLLRAVEFPVAEIFATTFDASEAVTSVE